MNPCPHLKVRHYDVAAPDMDDDDPNRAIARHYPMPCCTVPDQNCRYLEVLYPSPWHHFGVVPLCTGWLVVEEGGGRHPILKEIAPLLDESAAWPTRPPTQMHPWPEREELVAFAATHLLTEELCEQAQAVARKRGYERAVQHLVTALDGRVVQCSEYGPGLMVRGNLIGIYVQRSAPPALELPLEGVVRDVFTYAAAAGPQLSLF